MATDPSSLITQLLTQGANSFQQGQQQYQDNQAQQQSNQQALQLGAMKLQQAQQAQVQAQQQAAAKAQAWAAYQADPSHENLTKLYFAAPDEADALSKGASLLDADAKTSQTTQNGVLYNLADGGSTDQLTTQVQGLINAEQKAGLDTSQAQSALQDLQSGDPARIASARTSIKAQTRINLAALGAKGFSIDPAADDSSDYSIEGGYLLNKKSGEHQYLGGGNPKDNYIEVKNADGTTTQKYIGPQGGGDQSSGGGALPTTLPAIADRIGTIEGTGNNASSSASGYGQFTNGTWLSTYKAANPNSGLTDQQILAQRSNPDVAKSMLANLTAKNASMLQAGGVAPTADNVYLAHFLGIGDALAVAHADPNTPISQVVNKASIAANPSVLAGKTVGQVQQWAAAKMAGGTPGSGASGNRDITGTGPGDTPGIIPDNLSGEAAKAYLQQKNPGLANRINGILAGQIPYPNATRKDTQPILNAISQIDPSFDATKWKARNDTNAQYAAGGKVGINLTQGATAINHLYDVAVAAQNLPDHEYQWLNKADLATTANGSKQGQNIVQYNRSRTLYAPELNKYLSGTGGTSEGETNKQYNSYDPTLGRTNILKSAVTDTNFIANKFDQQAQSYQDTMGKPLVIDGQGKNGGPATAKLAAMRYWADNPSQPIPVVVANPAQAKALPKGTAFATMDGRVIIR